VSDEAGRIRQVYHQYDHDPSIQARRAADNPGNRYILMERFRAIVDLFRVYNLIEARS
jgi:hypothetical protein